ncbi:glycoside hydrolase family 3 N-terminal domain-containing protein [Pseudarthrobacter sp. J64]|uniref:glycoside hydrolase family 3 protein n=1 Tax=Pseudarthrobacter sp. J64 TaxID=3116485 RepID=UPI002E817C30|nr:glycoside hydrolase family 3 N-terminal domain-containing protein [Pseudarthrobacter sp. J64]MEE2568141.1 glycoside hydrolase family 3 N-terminal domain-containing protein [Pseudarthrobacter sp. J64]
MTWFGQSGNITQRFGWQGLAVSAAAALTALTACTATPASPPSSEGSPSVTSSPAASPRTAPASPDSTAADTASVPLGWGPEQRDADAATAALAGMTVEQKAGQVLVPFYSGADPAAQADTIRRLHLAGSIVMGDNVPQAAEGSADPAAMARSTAVLQEAVGADGRTWPGIVAVDQEGGPVARLRAPLTEWPAAMAYGAAGDPAMARDAGRAMGAELAGLGFTMNFAPDADVTIGPQDPVIRSRSFSDDPDAVAAHAVAMSAGLVDAGVLPAVKHFPGHGSVTVDSHVGLPVQGAGLAELEARDWKPFRAAVAAGLPMVMTGHIDVPALEPGIPASLSKATYGHLRSLGFKGVVVTDALNMGAIGQNYAVGEESVKALAAGADLLLMPPDVEAAHSAIVTAVGNGSLPEDRLNEAAARVITLMAWQGRKGAGTPPVPPGAGAAVSSAVSAKAVTVVAGPCSGRLVGDAVQVAGGSELDRARFTEAARAAGLAVGSGPVVRLVGPGAPPGAAGNIDVSLDDPWPLAGSAAGSVIAVYGRSPGSFEALVGVLTGSVPATGKLPVAVGSWPRGAGCA